MSKLKLSLFAIALATTSVPALAVTQGTVTFNGELISQTCNVAGDSLDIIVPLPTLSVDSLSAAGMSAGSKYFDIHVEGCPAGVQQVAAHFEAIGSSGMNSATGNLKNSFVDQGSDVAAQNVEVRLYNSNEQPLTLGEAGNPVAVTDGKATLRYYGGYYATGVATAGKVSAKAVYTLAYP